MWCCEMSKIKRRVTVDSAKSVPDEGDRRKPSVFERLGPGARKQLDDVKRNYQWIFWDLLGLHY